MTTEPKDKVELTDKIREELVFISQGLVKISNDNQEIIKHLEEIQERAKTKIPLTRTRVKYKDEQTLYVIFCFDTHADEYKAKETWWEVIWEPSWTTHILLMTPKPNGAVTGANIFLMANPGWRKWGWFEIQFQDKDEAREKREYFCQRYCDGNYDADLQELRLCVADSFSRTQCGAKPPKIDCFVSGPPEGLPELPDGICLKPDPENGTVTVISN